MIPLTNSGSIEISPDVTWGDGTIARYSIFLRFKLTPKELDALHEALKTLGWVK